MVQKMEENHEKWRELQTGDRLLEIFMISHVGTPTDFRSRNLQSFSFSLFPWFEVVLLFHGNLSAVKLFARQNENIVTGGVGDCCLGDLIIQQITFFFCNETDFFVTL